MPIRVVRILGICGVLTVLPVWVSKEGCSFVGKLLSRVTECSIPVVKTGMSLALLISAAKSLFMIEEKIWS
jgi:hypothetical protein